MLIDHIWKLHDLFTIIISDRDSQFVSLVWESLCKMFKIKTKLSTTFHLESDEQSERNNQEMKRYLRFYVNYQRNDWVDWLFIIDFVFNVYVSSFSELFFFMINKKFELRMSFLFIGMIDSAKERILKKRVESIIDIMKQIWEHVKNTLQRAQKIQKKQADKHRIQTSK